MEKLCRESCSLPSQAIALANKEVEKVIGRTKKRGVTADATVLNFHVEKISYRKYFVAKKFSCV